jgi:small-conductance mechanosensitive channel
MNILDYLLPENWQLENLNPLLDVAILVAAALIAAFVLNRLVFGLLSWNAQRFDSKTMQQIIRHVRRPALWLFFFFLLNIFAGSVELPEESFSFDWLQKIATVGLIISCGWLAMGVVHIVSFAVRNQYDLEDDQNNLQERKILTQLQYIRRIASIVIFVIAASIVLMQFEEIRTLGASLLTSAGVAGIIIGVAAQKSLANLLAGFQIAFTQPIRLDDVVIVAGEWGRIEEITLTYVVVRIWDQRRLVVPLQRFIEDSFQNWTRTNSELIGAVFLYTDYAIPINELRAELDRLLENHPKWDGRVKAVQVTDCKPEVIEVRMLVSAADAGRTFELRCDVREHMVGFIQRNYPEGLPQTRVIMSRAEDMERKRHQQKPSGEESPRTTSPAPEEGVEEIARKREEEKGK